MLRLGALATGLGNNIFVEQLHGAFKAGKLHHGVWNLPHPQRNYTLVEAAGGGDIVTAERMSRCVQNTNSLVVITGDKLNVRDKGPVSQILREKR